MSNAALYYSCAALPGLNILINFPRQLTYLPLFKFIKTIKIINDPCNLLGFSRSVPLLLSYVCTGKNT